ncbi:amidase [Xylophilus sp.]|uniref:amidase n=1 Tax=Xylophilus sp. TaxID=2653893 RepID=UPI0013BE3A17|nr:amidase [Xylophilus sp.]KAF1044484.1 MAG: 6-aminohexanoate-cyclic-dimer hydrolase [Xylophilus sp.]
MAAFTHYERHDALGLAALIRSGESSAAEVLEAAIARIETHNPTINAVVHTLHDSARRQAAAVRPGDGPLAGVPFLVKDSGLQIAGERTSNGSRFWRDHIAATDSTITQRYRRAGLVLLGFTNTAEMGLACETAPAVYGPTRNPHDLSRSVGGSSGGSAAAVAAGFVPAAHATDGGGSIRIPSSCCGVFGLKPTRARNPFGPDFGEGWNGLSAHHAITRSVRDSAALLDATHGPAAGDPYAAPATVPEGGFLRALSAPQAPLRIAFQTVRHDGTAVHPAVAGAVRDAAALLAGLGHHVEEARPAIDADTLKRATRTIVAANTAQALRLRAQAAGRPASEEEVEPITWLWSREGERLPAQQLAEAIGTIHALARRLGAFFERHDILLTPTFSAPPLPLGTVDMQSRDLDAYYERLRSYSAFTTIYNATGVPAASVPFARHEGLPIGVQIAAPLGHDARVLRLAAQIEQARPWERDLPTGATREVIR